MFGSKTLPRLVRREASAARFVAPKRSHPVLNRPLVPS